MDPTFSDEDELKLHDDTVRNLETLAHAPGELRFRIALVQAIKDLRREVAMMRIDIGGRLKVLETRKLLDHMQVARIANKEFADNKDFSQVRVDVKRLWNGAMWFLVLIVGGVIGAVLKVVLTK